MKRLVVLTILLGSVAVAQNGGVVSPPDIVGSIAKGQDSANKAKESAAQKQLLKQQTELLKAQTDALKQQNAQAAAKGVIAASGNEFLQKCENPDNAPVECVSYVAGVTDGLEMTGSSAGFCPPEGVTYGQSLRIVVKYAKDHPESLQKRTGLLVLASHAEAFPCAASPK